MSYNTIRYDTLYNQLERFLGYAQKYIYSVQYIKRKLVFFHIIFLFIFLFP
jgi:hypothetical protein